ncbi:MULTISPECIES: hypothetical protein [unclassified Pseudomonas]|uniref:hypothetical protein n=1 Tax=unclassified Pseudomonas TaxID=196821 RepID=UPI00131DBB11|nr:MULTISPECIES: hypothetical protein [unclassified Pseudomonas]
MTQDTTARNADTRSPAWVVLGFLDGQPIDGLLVDDPVLARGLVEHANAYAATMPTFAPSATPGASNEWALWEAAHPISRRASACTEFRLMALPWLDPATLGTPA